MTQDERWNIRYQEVLSFIETNRRNPSKYAPEERSMYNFIKHSRKQMNKGLMKEERVVKLIELLGIGEKYRHVNQYQ